MRSVPRAAPPPQHTPRRARWVAALIDCRMGPLSDFACFDLFLQGPVRVLLAELEAAATVADVVAAVNALEERLRSSGTQHCFAWC